MPHNFEKEYWDSRYKHGGNSGYGSYGDQLQKKLDWICPLDFENIVELGCGDFNFGMHILLRHPATYTGYDISEVVVSHNRECFPHQFRVYDGQPLPKADLVMCVDVLFHVIEDEEVERILQNLEQAWTKYLVITAYERDEEFTNHVRIRKFDYKRFGEPIVREIVEEDGELYFYIFKKDDQLNTGERVLYHERPRLSEGDFGPHISVPVWGNTAPHSLRQSA